MHTVGVMCGGARRVAPVELAFRRTCTQTRRACRIVRIADPAEVGRCDSVVLAPGGTLDDARAELAGGMAEALTGHVKAGKPLLGIALGMLAMFAPKGLGWFDGECREIPATTQPMTGAPAKVPHVGWNRLMLEPACHPVIAAAGRSGVWMYFSHDQYAAPADASLISATTEAGTLTLPASIHRDNVVGALFKPERSHRAGIRLMVAFLEQG